MGCHPERSEGSAVAAYSRCFVAALLSMTVWTAAGNAQTPVDTTVVIKSTGPVLEFDPTSLFLKEGTRVRLRFVNDGTLPHNVVFVRDEDDIDPLAQAAMQEGGDYVPKDMKAKMVAFTKLASPGQTVETIFVVPPAGRYMYVCLMSGHANLMLGTLRSLK
jgi:plastocyanin